jgi:hypothetical protein
MGYQELDYENIFNIFTIFSILIKKFHSFITYSKKIKIFSISHA